MIECKQKNKRRWSIIVKVAKYFAILGGIFTLLDGLIWYKTLRLTRFDVTALIIIITIYVILAIVKLKNRIKDFWKIFPNIFIIIFIYPWLVVCIYNAMYIYDPFIGSYVAPGITQKKILSMKIGDDKNHVIKLLEKPVEITYPYKGNKSIENGDPDKAVEKFIYAFRGIFYEGFDFNIFFIDDKLSKVVIKRDSGDMVYVCSRKYCPKIFNQLWLDELCELSRKSGH